MPLLLSTHLSGYISWTNRVQEFEPARTIRRMKTEPTADLSDARHAADARLLGLVATGDSAALGELYDRFSRPLYATALRILNDPGEAQDIVHDAFVAVWEKASSFETARGTAFSWVLTLTRNRAIDRLRSRRRRHELLETSTLSDLGLDENSSGPGADSAASSSDQATTFAPPSPLYPPINNARSNSPFSAASRRKKSQPVSKRPSARSKPASVAAY
jgi:RNA polymerase sigma factor (sigma-70 family)